MTHYDVEDVPPVDVDTTMALYQQSKVVVADGAALAERLLGEAGPVLESIYNIASKSNDTDTMVAVNDAWAKTQELARIVGQQGAALNGADAVIDVVKKSRDAALEELKKILDGLENYDTDAHPSIEKFREITEEIMVDNWEWYGYDDEPEYDQEVLVDQFYESLEPIMVNTPAITFIQRREVVEVLVDGLMGYNEWTDEQNELLRQLLVSCLPKADEDEDGDDE